MRRRALEDGISLLAGAGIGVALMYLFDPETGEERRERLRKQANTALDASGAALGTAWEGISSTAGDVGDTLRDRFADATDAVSSSTRSTRSSLADAGSGAWDNVRGFGRNVYNRAADTVGGWWDSASDYGDDVSSRAGKAIRRAGSYVPHEEEHHYVGQTACALGSLAIGAGIVWLLDPNRGRGRRAWLGDKTNSVLRETGDFFRKTGRHIANRSRGMYHETSSMVGGMTGSGGQMTDDQLCARIRSQLGHVTRNFGDVQVRAVQGRVTLTGSAPAEEIDAILNAVIGVRGVSGVDNQLRTRTSPGTVSGMSSGGPSFSSSSATSGMGA